MRRGIGDGVVIAAIWTLGGARCSAVSGNARATGRYAAPAPAAQRAARRLARASRPGRSAGRASGSVGACAARAARTRGTARDRGFSASARRIETKGGGIVLHAVSARRDPGKQGT